LKVVIATIHNTEYAGPIEPEFSSEFFGATYVRIELERPGGTIFVREDGAIYDPFGVLSHWEEILRPEVEAIERSERLTAKDLAVVINT